MFFIIPMTIVSFFVRNIKTIIKNIFLSRHMIRADWHTIDSIRRFVRTYPLSHMNLIIGHIEPKTKTQEKL